MRNLFFIALISLFSPSLLFYSCKSVPAQEESQEKQEKILSLVFAGDIMAHKENFRMDDFNKIWEDITPLIVQSDFAFANLEAPVCDELPYSTYPNFNMNSDFPEAAIKAGINVFSLVNNHSNDQGLKGILSTEKWASEKEQKTAISNRPVYFCGINKVSKTPISYKVIKKEDWTVLFCAVTEILNRPDFKSYLNYVVSSKLGWEDFSNYLKKIREENPCDLFILSIHTDEPEYEAKVSAKRKSYYKSLLENCNVDIIWANHPHVPREIEFFGKKETGNLEKFIIYGNGNTISGQRRNPDFKNPSNPRDNTGDSYLLNVVYSKTIESSPIIVFKEKNYITTYINELNEFVIKKLDDDFISYLNENNQKWAKYINSRKQITEKTEETIIWH